MTTEEKQALFAKLPEILQGANIGQLNMIVESGAKVVYQEQHFQGEQKPANSDANLPTANTVKMAEYLEPEKGIEHPVRQKLGESPEKPIKKAVDEYMKSKI